MTIVFYVLVVYVVMLPLAMEAANHMFWGHDNRYWRRGTVILWPVALVVMWVGGLAWLLGEMLRKAIYRIFKPLYDRGLLSERATKAINLVLRWLPS